MIDGLVLGHEVVGEQAGLQPFVAAADRLDHGRAHLAGQQGHHGAGVQLAAGGRASASKRSAELVEGDVAPLQAGPGVGVGVGGVELPDEAGGQPVVALVGGEGVERAGQDDPAEVPQGWPVSRPTVQRVAPAWVSSRAPLSPNSLADAAENGQRGSVPVRAAVSDDAPEVVRLGRLMFESMGIDSSDPGGRRPASAMSGTGWGGISPCSSSNRTRRPAGGRRPPGRSASGFRLLAIPAPGRATSNGCAPKRTGEARAWAGR